MGKTTTYTYTAFGKVESVVDSLNNCQEFTYDSMGRNTVVRDALNNTSTAEYDMLGNVLEVIDAAADSLSKTYVTFTFQQSGDQKRVIIKSGSTDAHKIFDEYANNLPYSAYFQNAGSYGQSVELGRSANLYEQLTGNESKWYELYDTVITVDKAHQGSGYTSYLWYDDAQLMQSPIIYGNDKVEVGKRKGLFSLGFEPSANVPINNSYPASPHYQMLFEDFLNE